MDEEVDNFFHLSMRVRQNASSSSSLYVQKSTRQSIDWNVVQNVSIVKSTDPDDTNDDKSVYDRNGLSVSYSGVSAVSGVSKMACKERVVWL